jgi:predicted transcriptional regulator
MANALTIRLDPELVKALEEEARRTGSNKGEIVREAIRDRLASSRRSALDALQDLNGIVDGPADLSTNKRHLADLGRRRSRR